jgi:hypothetical protein
VHDKAFDDWDRYERGSGEHQKASFSLINIFCDPAFDQFYVFPHHLWDKHTAERVLTFGNSDILFKYQAQLV